MEKEKEKEIKIEIVSKDSNGEYLTEKKKDWRVDSDIVLNLLKKESEVLEYFLNRVTRKWKDEGVINNFLIDYSAVYYSYTFRPKIVVYSKTEVGAKIIFFTKYRILAEDMVNYKPSLVQELSELIKDTIFELMLVGINQKRETVISNLRETLEEDKHEITNAIKLMYPLTPDELIFDTPT